MDKKHCKHFKHLKCCDNFALKNLVYFLHTTIVTRKDFRV